MRLTVVSFGFPLKPAGQCPETEAWFDIRRTKQKAPLYTKGIVPVG